MSTSIILRMSSIAIASLTTRLETQEWIAVCAKSRVHAIAHPQKRSLNSVYGWETNEPHCDGEMRAINISIHVPSNIADDQSRQCLTTTKNSKQTCL